jgi:fatty acid desaturase
MLPRNPADYRAILWAILMPVVVIAQFVRPTLVPYLSPLSFYFAMAAGTMAHNHNHCPTFKSRKVNEFYATWISLFYGYPTFAWVPTHNLNHHKHVNREGDATITWRHSKRNTWWIAVSYFFISAYYQSTPIKEYIAKAKRSNPKLHAHIVKQYAVWGTVLVAAAVANIVMHGPLMGMKVFALAFGLPCLFGTWSMMWFNYMQHVHCDPWSAHNHSRNITGRIFNFLVFNNGLHTIHHENPGSHWSKAYALHDEIKDQVDPRLNEPSFLWWVFRAYVITAIFPSLETKQVGRAAYDAPADGEGAGPKTHMREKGPMIDSVDAVDAGTNAQMA